MNPLYLDFGLLVLNAMYSLKLSNLTHISAQTANWKTHGPTKSGKNNTGLQRKWGKHKNTRSYLV